MNEGSTFAALSSSLFLLAAALAASDVGPAVDVDVAVRTVRAAVVGGGAIDPVFLT